MGKMTASVAMFIVVSVVSAFGFIVATRSLNNLLSSDIILLGYVTHITISDLRNAPSKNVSYAGFAKGAEVELRMDHTFKGTLSGDRLKLSHLQDTEDIFFNLEKGREYLLFIKYSNGVYSLVNRQTSAYAIDVFTNTANADLTNNIRYLFISNLASTNSAVLCDALEALSELRNDTVIESIRPLIGHEVSDVAVRAKYIMMLEGVYAYVPDIAMYIDMENRHAQNERRRNAHRHARGAMLEAIAQINDGRAEPFIIMGLGAVESALVKDPLMMSLIKTCTTNSLPLLLDSISSTNGYQSFYAYQGLAKIARVNHVSHDEYLTNKNEIITSLINRLVKDEHGNTSRHATNSAPERGFSMGPDARDGNTRSQGTSNAAPENVRQ